jgi:hypothetical protein
MDSICNPETSARLLIHHASRPVLEFTRLKKDEQTQKEYIDVNQNLRAAQLCSAILAV